MNQSKPKYDLEDRTKAFAKNIRIFAKSLPRNSMNTEDKKQLIRASGSVAANYIEANESLGKGDFHMRLKICRKEAKESYLWLDLIDVGSHEDERQRLLKEARELVLIFAAILRKCGVIK